MKTAWLASALLHGALVCAGLLLVVPVGASRPPRVAIALAVGAAETERPEPEFDPAPAPELQIPAPDRWEEPPVDDPPPAETWDEPATLPVAPATAGLRSVPPVRLGRPLRARPVPAPAPTPAPPPAAVVAAAPPPSHVSGALVAPRPLAEVCRAPAYPEDARRLGHEGEVTLRIDVARDGSVARLEVVASSGYAELDAAALDAVRVWRFEPARCGGRAVAHTVRLPLRFSLAD